MLINETEWPPMVAGVGHMGNVGQLGQQVKVRTDSSRETFTGTVEQINRQAEFTPRNVQTVEDRVRQVFGVKVRLPSDNPKLRAGMSVDVFSPRFHHFPSK